MATFCLLPHKVDAFKKALKEKKITISELLNMSSEARTKLLEKYAGKNAKDVNLLFEKKLVLKNKMLGLKNWASKVGEVGRYDPAKKAELAKMTEDYKKMQEERIFNPSEEQSFFNELADQVIGTHITRVEAKNIFELSYKANELKDNNFNFETGKFKTKEGAMEYGMAESIKQNYIEDLTGAGDKLSTVIKNRLSEFSQTKSNDGLFRALADITKSTAKTTKQLLISIIGSNDVSFGLRQGFTALLDSPKIWWSGFAKQFGDIGKAFKGRYKEAKIMLDAEIYARDNYANGIDRLAGFDKKIVEEETIAGNLLEKAPYIGRDIQASDIAFNGMAQRVRYGIFDKHIELLETMGKDIFDKDVISQAKDIALRETGRAKIGQRSILDTPIFWAPKMIKSAFDTLTAPINPYKSAYVRKQATYTLLKYISIYIASKTIQNSLDPNSATYDPRETRFKNIATLGDTNISIGRGELSLITLASRLVPTLHNGEWGFWTVNSNGIYKKFEGKFGQGSPLDTAMNFLKGKTNPYASILRDYLEQSMYGGKKFTIPNELKNVQPISFKNFEEVVESKDFNELIGAIADLPGASASTYNSNIEDWSEKNTKDIIQFKSEVTEEEFKQANEEYNNSIKDEIGSLIKTEEYRKLSEEDKQKRIDKIKANTKKEIFKKYAK